VSIVWCQKAYSQRTRLAAVWGFEIRLPVTAAWLCFVVEVKNFCLALFVKLGLKHNSEQKLMLIPSSPNCSKPNVGRS